MNTLLETHYRIFERTISLIKRRYLMMQEDVVDQEEIAYRHEFSFETEHRLPDQFIGPRAVAKLEIFPKLGHTWTFTLLAVFLNEISDFVKTPRRGFTKDESYVGRPNGRFHFIHKDHSKYFIIIDISGDIVVRASVKWIVEKWKRYQIAEYSLFRSQGKHRSHPELQIHNFFSISFDSPSIGTKRLFHNEHLYYCSPFDFSKAFHYFAKNIVTLGLCSSSDTNNIMSFW